MPLHECPGESFILDSRLAIFGVCVCVCVGGGGGEGGGETVLLAFSL